MNTFIPPVFDIAKQVNPEEYDFDKSCEEVAASRCLDVVYPEDNQLQLDIDTEEQYQEFLRRTAFFEFACEVSEKPSASGYPNRHITMTFPNHTFSTWERIALQAALGSDPIREFLSARRYWQGIERPSCLFEVPQTQLLPDFSL